MSHPEPPETIKGELVVTLVLAAMILAALILIANLIGAIHIAG